MYLESKLTVFLSHSHHDIEKVRKIRNILETLNCEPLTFFLKCLDDKNAELEEFIKKEIEARNIFIYCKSQNAEKSEWVQKELEHIKSFDSSRLYILDLDESFEIGLVCVLNEIVKILHRNTIIIWGARSENTLISDKLTEACIANGYRVKYFVPDINGSFDGLSTWEYQKLRTQYENYIEKTISIHIKEGVFIPILTPNVHDGGFGEYMHRKILSIIKRETQAITLPLFVDYSYPDIAMQNIGLSIHTEMIDEEMPKVIERINKLVK